MVYSDKEQWFFEEAKEGNAVAIKGINSRPEIPDYLQFVWEAFWALSGDRPVFMGGVGPIAFLSVDRYAERFGLDSPDEFARFFELIRSLDAVYVRHANSNGSSP